MEDTRAASAANAPDPLTAPFPGLSVMDSDASSAHTLAVQVVPVAPPDETLKHVAAMTGAVVWPIVAVVALVLFREKLAGLVESFSIRIKDPRTTFEAGPIKIGNELRDLKFKGEETDTRVQVLTQLEADRSVARTDAAKPISDELKNLAQQYEEVNDSALEKRIQRKDDLAAKMAGLVISEQIPRGALAEGANNDGLRTALATVVNTLPLPRDDEWLATAGPGAVFKHTRYRFMMAIARLARLGMLSPSRAREFLGLAETYKKEADKLLLERIARTEELLNPRAH